MITGYKQLTGKYLKSSKKRAVLTIIGIMLSVALISTIGLFFYSLQMTEIEDAKNTYGAFHLMYKNADEDLVSKVTNNPKVSRSGLYSMSDTIKVDDKVSVSKVDATNKALELLPCKLVKGRMPENEKEAAIEKWAIPYVDKEAKVGSSIHFNNKEYKLVGILENNLQDQIDNKALILTKSNNINIKNSILLVEVSSKANLRATVDELKKLAPKDNVAENTFLLSVEGAAGQGSGLKGLYVTLGIIISIVVISTIAVIYNSFQISVVERIKQFGLLRAVGSTPKQIRRIVLREATFLAVIGIPLGLLCGVVAMYGIGFVFKLIGAESVYPMKTYISPKIMLLSAAVGIASVYISALIPAFFAGRISPLVAISSRLSITKEKIKKRKNKVTQRIIQKLFGFEGALASKNIRRNRKRYRITVFSIVISVVLFVTFKSFMDMAFTIGDTPNESNNMHFTVVSDGNKNNLLDDKIVEKLKAVSDVNKIYKAYSAYSFEAEINKSSEFKDVKDIGNIYDDTIANDNKKSIIQSYIEPYDEVSLESSKGYLQSGSIDKEELNKENGVIIIGKNTVLNYKTKKKYVGPLVNIKVGDEINVQFNSYEEQSDGQPKFGDGKIKKVKVLAILKDDPFNFRGPQEALRLISTKEVCEKLTGISSINPTSLDMTIKNVKNEESAKNNIENAIKSTPNLRLINDIDQNRKAKTSMLMVQILIYGFVIVVSLIGSVNIINTMTTNIILRKREFASLKSIGLTQRGLRKMIILEGMLYGIIGTIYGSIAGCGLSYLMYRGLNGVRDFNWPIPWKAIVIAGIAALVIGYLSVLAPLSRIKKENLIEAIREDY